MTSWILMHGSTGKRAFCACNIQGILIVSHQMGAGFISHRYRGTVMGLVSKYHTTIGVYRMNFKNRGHTTRKKSFAIRRI